jgi:LysR family transcriptional regulator, transcriptional activator of the cysJI operon
MGLVLDSLRVFCDLVETGSFSRTAERQFVSQSAVSQKLRALERSVGHVLLERGRGKGRVTPTEAGRVLYQGAVSLLREAEELEARIQGLSEEVAGTVRVATVYSVGLHALPGRLKPFLARYPRVNVHLEYSQTTKIYQDVLSGTVDVGIVACPTARAGIEVIPFGEEAMVLICAAEHHFAGRAEVELAELEGMPFIGFADDIPTRRLIDEHLRRAGVKVRLVNAFDNIETIKNLVEIGSGVALVPEDTARQEVKAGELAAVPLSAGSAFLRPAGLLVKNTRSRRAAVEAFVASVRAQQ